MLFSNVLLVPLSFESPAHLLITLSIPSLTSPVKNLSCMEAGTVR